MLKRRDRIEIELLKRKTFRKLRDPIDMHNLAIAMAVGFGLLFTGILVYGILHRIGTWIRLGI